ncbi:MAG TPA: 3-phenylpropionate/cinnamic acid dioxygenase subunit beta [Caldimonas sp.]|nr:3-phenylpropionate/cinnamic acid dioxygenase subunit beta [Caldimonas sp.]
MTTELAEIPSVAASASLQDVLLLHEVQQFLYHEAELLDGRRYEEWYGLLADDLEYWMPVRSTRARGDEANEFTKPGESAFFDETKELMAARVRKLQTPYSWAEDPPSRTRRILSNIRILEAATDGSVKASCNFLLYRSRLADDEDVWVGRREDTLRRAGERWQIVRRHIYLDQVSLGSKNLSIFF